MCQAKKMVSAYRLLTVTSLAVHGLSQSGPYSRVRDLFATFTLIFSFAAAMITVPPLSESRGAQIIDRFLAALG